MWYDPIMPTPSKSLEGRVVRLVTCGRHPLSVEPGSTGVVTWVEGTLVRVRWDSGFITDLVWDEGDRWTVLPKSACA